MSAPDLLSGINPVTRIFALLVYTTPLLLSVDWVSASISLVATLLLAPLCGVSWLTLWRRGWAIVALAPIAGLSMALYARPVGEEYFHFLFAVVTDNSLELALAIMIRVVAVAWPVIVLLIRIDPTDLGDGLTQVCHLPARFVLSAVAGARLVTLFRDDWDSLTRARRARGIADRGRIRYFFTLTFGLLVMSLRRGEKLATAMEARGFGRPGVKRTWARVATVGLRDLMVVLVALAVSLAAIAGAIALGEFRFLGA